MRQPDDPGVPSDEELQEAGRQLARDHLRQIPERDQVRIRRWALGLAIALFVSMIFLAWRNADAQDPPVPLEEPCVSGDCTVYNQAFLFAFTGDERTIRWSLVQSDVDNMDLFTELEVLEFPPKGGAFPVMRAELVEADREFGWTPTRAGTYYIEARACRTDVPDPNDPDAEQHPTRGVILCSIIASSTDPAHVDPGVYPRGFVMLIKLPPATGGGIE